MSFRFSDRIVSGGQAGVDRAALAYAFLSRLAGDVEPRDVAAGLHEATTSDDTSDPPGDLNETLARRRASGQSNRILCLTPYVAPWPASIKREH